MAKIPFPQHDLPRDRLGRTLSGGADLWDDGLAGSIITDEYFELAIIGNTLWIKIAGVWKTAIIWIKVSGVWKVASIKLNVSGVWT